MSSCACLCEERGCTKCCYCGRTFMTAPPLAKLEIDALRAENENENPPFTDPAFTGIARTLVCTQQALNYAKEIINRARDALGGKK